MRFYSKVLRTGSDPSKVLEKCQLSMLKSKALLNDTRKHLSQEEPAQVPRDKRHPL